MGGKGEGFIGTIIKDTWTITRGVEAQGWREAQMTRGVLRDSPSSSIVQSHAPIIPHIPPGAS